MTVLNFNEFIKFVYDYNYIEMSDVNASFRNSPKLICIFFLRGHQGAKAKVQITTVELNSGVDI